MANSARLTEFAVENTSTTDAGSDDKWDVELFKKKLRIEMKSVDDNRNTIEFDIIGTVAPIVNAFRRILLAEVPTMAIDKVLLYNNTSVIQDEVLAHRVGLIPINVDPRLFEYRQEGDEEGSPEDTIEFELKVKCTKNPHTPSEGLGAGMAYNNRSVYSNQLKFIPRGEQATLYGEIKPVDDDILIAKLAPGHEIDLRAHCVKGIGRDHAKFSPVATATYRLLSEIKLLREISGDSADTFARCFSDGVIEVVEKKGKNIAVVADPRKDNSSRNVFYYEEFHDAVQMSKKKDHFIFTIESTGCLPADVLFLEAVGVLKEKTRYFLNELRKLENVNKES